ncbi:tripartite tricarboxylate transporter TctB family protein [Sphaerochaeta sp.]|uniref:tripartite tricarboxylate transporter TctB family protein n=1 Tax=Sphaerochaeta sp. TaxID=1972642 RepID=UPI002FC8879C
MNKKLMGLGVFSFLFGLVLFLLTFQIKDFAAIGVGAKFFPRIAGFGFIILSLVFLLQAFAKSNTEQPKTKQNCNTPAVLLSMFLLIAYLAAISSLGYIIASTLYIFLQIRLLHKGQTQHYLQYALLSVISATVTYLLFVKVFGVMIPAGLLG